MILLHVASKHSRPKGLLNPISISGGIDNPSVEVEYKGRQSQRYSDHSGRKVFRKYLENKY